AWATRDQVDMGEPPVIRWTPELFEGVENSAQVHLITRRRSTVRVLAGRTNPRPTARSTATSWTNHP
ncbi:MAG TPA: hypothetical protein VFE65_10915, partial [Pseudonocardia sp.]|nr:hypothetical protein [Pseudonocardia sp.]